MNTESFDSMKFLENFIEKQAKQRTRELERKVRQLEKQNRLAKELADLVQTVRNQNERLVELQNQTLSLLQEIVKLLKVERQLRNEYVC